MGTVDIQGKQKKLMEQEKDKIKISSADGWNEIEFRRISTSNDCLVEILAKGKFSERCQNFQAETTQLVDDFSINFLQGLLLREKLVHFSESLESWFIKPSEINVELTSRDYPILSIFVGETDEFICSSMKPVFVFRYKDSRIETSIKFVTDQSCLNLMLQDLKRWLRN